MTRYQAFKQLHLYAEEMEKNYAALKKTLAGACGKMEAEAEVVPSTQYYQSLRAISWADFFFRSNYASKEQFEKIAVSLETEPLPGIMEYGLLARIVESENHDSFRQKMETAASILEPCLFSQWMAIHREEAGGISVESDDDGFSVDRIHLSLPMDMETVGRLCMMYPEIAPVLSMLMSGGESDDE